MQPSSNQQPQQQRQAVAPAQQQQQRRQAPQQQPPPLPVALVDALPTQQPLQERLLWQATLTNRLLIWLLILLGVLTLFGLRLWTIAESWELRVHKAAEELKARRF